MFAGRISQSCLGDEIIPFNVAGRKGLLRSLTFSPDSSQIVTGDSAGYIRFWQAMSGALIRELNEPGMVVDLAYSPDGKQLGVCITERMIKLMDTATGLARTRLEGQDEVGGSMRSPGLKLAFCPDGNAIAATKNFVIRRVSRDALENHVVIWDLKDGKRRHDLAAHHGPITSLSYSPDSRIIATASLDNTVKLWEAATGKLVRQLNDQVDKKGVSDLGYSPDGKLIIAASAFPIPQGPKGVVCVLDTGSGLEKLRFEGYGPARYSPDGKWFTFATGNGKIQFRNTESGKLVAEIDCPVPCLTAFSPDHKLFATAGGDHVVKVWNLKGLLEKN